MTSDMAFECLVVARDPAVFSPINHLLRELSICAQICLRPSEALGLLTRSNTDLLVVDCDIEDSIELLHDIGKSGKSRKPTIVAIAQSDCHVPGAHVVLKKPVTVEMGAKSLKIAYSRMLQDFRRQARCALMMSTMGTTEDGRTFSITVTDLGDGGLGLKTKEELTVGDVLSFRLLLPGTCHPLLIHSRVLWTREYGTAGCEFVHIPPTDVKILHDWLKQRLQVRKPIAK